MTLYAVGGPSNNPPTIGRLKYMNEHNLIHLGMISPESGLTAELTKT
eukprot:CAMPEP_0116873008 /NCGR_PEP_ID=MMETSP0463-20121206/3964_1 /TAXON_ID=181622 /ORGANISM="Strombidinopsis sp, Strain SopsisLIS2011" /LENGTH=46 /DNA_ID= /DNA_START= /DNA_END= /DNA_ORIENTATION=